MDFPTVLMAAIRRRLKHSPPFTSSELRTVRSLVVPELDLLGGLEALGGLKRLTLYRSALNKLGGIGRLQSLEKLEIEDSSFSSIEEVAKLPNLRWFIARNCPIQDLAPLASCSALEEVTVLGGAYSDESRFAVLPKLESDRCRLVVDDVAIWRVNRRLVSLGAPGMVTGSADALTLRLYRVAFGRRAGDFVPIDFGELREHVVHDDFNFEAYWKEQIERRNVKADAHWEATRPERERLLTMQQAYRDHTERSDASAARSWVETSELGDEAKRACLRFVARFEGCQFMRYRLPLVEALEAFYDIKLPAWSRAQAQALVRLATPPKTLTNVTFDRASLPNQRLAKERWWVGIFTTMSDGEQENTLPLGHYPVAQGPHGMMLSFDHRIDDPTICYFRLQDREDIASCPVMFANYAEMLDAIRSLRYGDTLIEARPLK